MSEQHNGNGWSRYEVHVLETLSRLEDNMKSLENCTRRYMERDEESRNKIALEMSKLKQDCKWYVRIFNGFTAVIVLAVNYFMGSK